jgi:hypothetical protein
VHAVSRVDAYLAGCKICYFCMIFSIPHVSSSVHFVVASFPSTYAILAREHANMHTAVVARALFSNPREIVTRASMPQNIPALQIF